MDLPILLLQFVLGSYLCVDFVTIGALGLLASLVDDGRTFGATSPTSTVSAQHKVLNDKSYRINSMIFLTLKVFTCNLLVPHIRYMFFFNFIVMFAKIFNKQ
jgi:hypothetical protein